MYEAATTGVQPLARLAPLVGDRRGEPRLGFLAGRITVPDNFDEMGAEELADLFEGR